MKMLALEFSSERRSVALADAGGVRAVARESAPRSVGPIALITQALQAAGWTRDELDTLTVGLGPGSYHGVRVALALAQGWHLARAVALLGISTMDALALQGHGQGWRGDLHLVVDAQRGEFYLATYTLDTEGPRALGPIRLVDAATVRATADSGVRLAGPDPGPDGAGVISLNPDAAALAEWALRHPQPASTEPLEPIYLRPTTFAKAPPPRAIPPLQ